MLLVRKAISDLLDVFLYHLCLDQKYCLRKLHYILSKDGYYDIDNNPSNLATAILKYIISLLMMLHAVTGLGLLIIKKVKSNRLEFILELINITIAGGSFYSTINNFRVFVKLNASIINFKDSFTSPLKIEAKNHLNLSFSFVNSKPNSL